MVKQTTRRWNDVCSSSLCIDLRTFVNLCMRKAYMHTCSERFTAVGIYIPERLGISKTTETQSMSRYVCSCAYAYIDANNACICIYIYICAYVRTYMHKHRHIRVSIHVTMFTYIPLHS